MPLGAETFSLDVAQHGGLEASVDSAVGDLVQLVDAIYRQRSELEEQRQLEPLPANSADQPRQADKPQDPRAKGVRLLLESGEGYASNPQWLVDVVQQTNRRLAERKEEPGSCQIALNLARMRITSSDPEEIQSALRGFTADDPEANPRFPVGCVIADMATFAVAPVEGDPAKMQILAERSVDYRALLPACSKLVAGPTPLIIRYVGPSAHQQQGVRAAVALSRDAIRTEVPKPQAPPENARPGQESKPD
jgi:hypothetical protein